MDFKRAKDGMAATVQTIEYDPNRTARIALVVLSLIHIFCAENAPIVLEQMTFPEPVIGLAVEPKTQKDLDLSLIHI